MIYDQAKQIERKNIYTVSTNIQKKIRGILSFYRFYYQDKQTKRENVYAGSINMPKRKSDTFLSFVGLLLESSELYNSGPQDEP